MQRLLKAFADAANREALADLERLLARSSTLDVNVTIAGRLRISAPDEFAAGWPHIGAEADAREREPEHKRAVPADSEAAAPIARSLDVVSRHYRLENTTRRVTIIIYMTSANDCIFGLGVVLNRISSLFNLTKRVRKSLSIRRRERSLLVAVEAIRKPDVALRVNSHHVMAKSGGAHPNEV